MPRIFDNINLQLQAALRGTLQSATRADFCVGYFNLRGWRFSDDLIKHFSGVEDSCCRVLVGMQQLPQNELRMAQRISTADEGIDQQTALCLKKRAAEEFREQLVLGVPTDVDGAGLQRGFRSLYNAVETTLQPAFDDIAIRTAVTDYTRTLARA
jgi:hypothetical protein